MKNATEMKALRKALNLTQAQMADRLGVTPRGYQDIEGRDGDLKPVHALAVERLALSVAIEKGDPMLAPAAVRREALALAALITGQ